jgi:RNA polymerase sigma-70 factor (ECF subfamily)
MSPVFSFRRSDAALVRQALAQQPEAFDALVVRHQRQAHAIARAVGARASAVDDVVQQAFLQAFRGLHGLRQPANFGPWLLSIVRNTARNHLRDEHRAPAFSGGGAAEDYLNLQAAPPASEPIEVRELRELLWRQVAELPEGIREAIQLFYHEGESVREVARALQISVPAAKQRLKRGRDVLREDLWRELEESLRDMLPGAREWERKARALSLLLFAAVPASWSRATLAAAASSATGLSSASVTCSHGLLPSILGGLTVTGKKLALSFSIALLFVAGGLLVMMRLPQESREGATTKASSDTAVVARATTPRVNSNRSSENAGLGDPLAADRGTVAAAEDALPIAIEGRVTSDGHGVASARVVALQLTSWSAISHTADDETDLEKRLARLREACDQQAKNVPQARSGLDGAFAFRGLPGGDYRLFTSHPGLPAGRKGRGHR